MILTTIRNLVHEPPAASLLRATAMTEIGQLNFPAWEKLLPSADTVAGSTGSAETGL